ncbi:uncharacterized protein EHS24_005652 [Apiotrichum porosum]|uniref:Uncharacterized protein n=1 Tax=Apiotrichum porosum TaxID=105984 RepID=A0A427XZ76_9TREE|nr:uncharacterized protein EHS24_005652 [Apiotrichum porosum]RSH84149.1 hypothetical protein EHS24_005652 [Apiotrichum porosum]
MHNFDTEALLKVKEEQVNTWRYSASPTSAKSSHDPPNGQALPSVKEALNLAKDSHQTGRDVNVTTVRFIKTIDVRIGLAGASTPLLRESAVQSFTMSRDARTILFDKPLPRAMCLRDLAVWETRRRRAPLAVPASTTGNGGYLPRLPAEPMAIVASAWSDLNRLSDQLGPAVVTANGDVNKVLGDTTVALQRLHDDLEELNSEEREEAQRNAEEASSNRVLDVLNDISRAKTTNHKLEDLLNLPDDDVNQRIASYIQISVPYIPVNVRHV